MTVDPRKPIFDAIRAARGRGYTQPDVDSINAYLDTIGVPRELPTKVTPPLAGEPAWTRAGRTKLGEREIPGAKHNPWILSFWKQTPWLKTDDSDSPWCGGFMKWCMEQAGIAYPKDFPRAKAWADWGVPVPRSSVPVGTIGVKTRDGGGHVGQIVGITADGVFYKVLGGNQNNMVSITDIRVADFIALRWPVGVPLPAGNLPIMPRGTTGASEG